MSTTVTYKGSTLTTVDNQTRTLKTAGKYMEGDVILTDVTSGGSTINNQNKTVTPTESQQSITADSGYTGLGTVTIDAISSTYVGSGITRDPELSASTNNHVLSVYADSGYYSTGQTYQVPAVTFDSTTAYLSGRSDSFIITQPVASSGYLDYNISLNIDPHDITYLDVIDNTLTITPTESEQIAAAAYTLTLGDIKVGAISSTYVGSGITQRSSSDLTASGATVSVPAGYYSAAASKSVATGSATGPSSLSESSASITTGTNTITLTKTGVTTTPTVSAGYVSSATASTATVALTASVTVNPTLTVSGATVTAPAGYYSDAASASVSSMTLPTAAASSATSGYTSKATIGRSTSAQYINIPPGYNSAGAYYVISATPNGSVTAPSSISGTAATISTGSGTLTLTKTVSVTPNVTTAGYISSGTAGNSSVSLTANVTINPTLTVSGPTVTAPAGYYTENASKSVATMTPPSEPSNNYTSGYTRLDVVDRATTTRYINIPPGYNSTGVYYQISAVANGSAKTPATTITANPTITISDNGLITATASASQSVTPTVSAGYVSSGTAGTITVSGSKTQQLTTKAAATITPTTTNQTIASGTYLTGTQTILGDPDLVGPNIVQGASIFNINGTATFQSYYTGSSAPASSLGNNGDIYLQE